MDLITTENLENKVNTPKLSDKLIIDNPPEDVIGKNSLWDDNIEKAAKEIGELSKIYKLMHIHSAQKSYTLYNIFMYLSIVIGPTAGVISGILTNFDGDTQKYLSILITILSFISGIIATILKFGRFEEESNSNKLAASKYTSLENNVRRQLALSRKNRIPATDYIEWINKSFDELFIASPLLSADIFLKYEKNAEKLGIKLPEYRDTITVNENFEEKIQEQLENKNSIKINRKSIDTINSEENVKNKSLKKTKTYNNIQEINQFEDGRMNYELKRFLHN
jgi:hypothetical protein